MDLTRANTLLQSFPYQCHLCGTGVITNPNHVLQHMSTKRHMNACARKKLNLECTNVDGSSCLTSDLKTCLIPRKEAKSKLAPELDDSLNMSSQRLRSSLAPNQLSALCDHVELLVQTLNVVEVSSLLSEHGFKETNWLHLEDNTTRVKALCTYIMRTNNASLYTALSVYFERRRQEYDEISRVFQDPPFNVRQKPVSSSNKHELSTDQESNSILQSKIQQMSNELEHYRRLQLHAATNDNSSAEQWRALSNLIRQELSTLSAEQKTLSRANSDFKERDDQAR